MLYLLLLGLFNLFFFFLGFVFIVGRIFKWVSGEKVFKGTLEPWSPKLCDLIFFILLLLVWALLIPQLAAPIAKLFFPEVPLNEQPVYLVGFSGALSVVLLLVVRKLYPQAFPERFSAPIEERPRTWLKPTLGENIWTLFGFLLFVLFIATLISMLVPVLFPEAEELWEKNQLLVDNLRNLEDHRALFFAIPATVIFAPICEEIIFRVGIYRLLKARIGGIAAGILTAICFAALHDTLAGFLPLAAMSCVLCYAYERTGRLAMPIILHALFNAYSVLQVLMPPELPHF